MKTRRGYQGSVLLVELTVVVLFFALTATISMGVFVRARQMADEAAQLSQASECLSEWAEELSLTAEAEAFLQQEGFRPEAGTLTLRQGALVYTARVTREETEAGLRTKIALAASLAEGRELTALTAGGYFGKEGAR